MKQSPFWLLCYQFSRAINYWIQRRPLSLQSKIKLYLYFILFALFPVGALGSNYNRIDFIVLIQQDYIAGMVNNLH